MYTTVEFLVPTVQSIVGRGCPTCVTQGVVREVPRTLPVQYHGWASLRAAAGFVRGYSTEDLARGEKLFQVGFVRGETS